MKTAHFTITQHAGQQHYRGALFPSLGTLLLDYCHICELAHGMGFFNALRRSLMIRMLSDAWDVPGGCERALDMLCSYLSLHAAPGYEFTACIIDGKKVWGWFPREG